MPRGGILPGMPEETTTIEIFASDRSRLNRLRRYPGEPYRIPHRTAASPPVPPQKTGPGEEIRRSRSSWEARKGNNLSGGAEDQGDDAVPRRRRSPSSTESPATDRPSLQRSMRGHPDRHRLRSVVAGRDGDGPSHLSRHTRAPRRTCSPGRQCMPETIRSHSPPRQDEGGPIQIPLRP